MSRPREPWWGYVKNVIRRYPAYEAELKRLKATSVTTRYSKGRGAGGSSRKTELTALRSLPEKDQLRHDAVARALQKTKRMQNGELRCRMIDLTYFSGRCNMQGAALTLHVSYMTVRRWHVDFVRLVAEYLDLI